jgi:CheY-like chemotaxis protein
VQSTQDIEMPVMNGIIATQKLRASGFTKPIIALTANALKTQQQTYLEAGCDLVHTKPLHAKLLIEQICAQYKANH